MYEETKLEYLPKYFKNLHLEVSAICGSPRIAAVQEGKSYTDKYINIPKEEWESALLNWAEHLEKGYVQATKNGSFIVAGTMKNPSIKEFVKVLKNLIKELEENYDNK